ncbi:MAG: methyltransferase domain-containing protein [Gammaproteobacteria bacterium]|nr:methyltransferase domain-containing protein [Gammaproteobacteria bacterium]
MNLLSKHETRRRLLLGMPDADMLSSQVAHWFQSPQGEAVLRAEKEAIHRALEKLFGYHILQLGLSEEHSLIEQSPVGHKIIFSPSFRAGSTRAVASNEALPLCSDSIDVVVIHHALDFAANSHRVVREATRVLRPGGHMLIVGFNPYSYWGFWKLFKRKKNIPWRGKFISKGRVSDWLKLLDLHIDSVSYGLHFMPVAMSKLLIHAQSLEKLGNKLHSPLGGAYFIHCIKQSMPVTPILPKWQPLRTRPSVMPATENVRAKIKIH